MGKSTDPRMKALRDVVACEAELKKTERLKIWPEVIEQINLRQVDDSMFHDRCARLAVSSPTTATAYLWWAQLQGVPNAAIAWRWLKHKLFSTAEDEIIEALKPPTTVGGFIVLVNLDS